MKKQHKLSKYATLDKDAERLKTEKEDIRPPFFRDIDRILYSLSFIRYLDKTQVFTYQKNSHLTKRMIHVQYVSKIARTIGRALYLNEDLIEAIALGHDLGHTPFGHVGEEILNELSLKYTNTYFKHNIHSVRLLMDIEKYGKGLNLAYQTLEGIMCHNGEILEAIYEPLPKTKENFLNEYKLSYNENIVLRPSTLEGCVVRISDLIGYLGRDIEDGIRLGLVKKTDIPKHIKDVIGVNNKDIVNTIILDIIKNSKNKPYIKLSDDVFSAMRDLKEFNYNNIYKYAYTDTERKKIKTMFNTLFNYYLTSLNKNNKTSAIYNYVNKLSSRYQKNAPERIVIDYIAGMTDYYFHEEYEKVKNK